MKKLLFSLLKSILWTLTLVMSISFPNAELYMIEATAQEVSTIWFSSFLSHLSAAFLPGYGVMASIVAGLLAYYFYKSDICKKNSYDTIWLIISIFFGCINTAGMCMRYLDRLTMFYSVDWMLICVMLICGYASIFYTLTKIFIDFLNSEKYIIEEKLENERKYFAKVLVVIIIVWLPWLIAYYPASMDNDVFAQLYSAMYEPSNHHPWFSSFILTCFYSIGKSVFGNDNIGIFLYISFRDLIIASVYAYGILQLRRTGIKKAICIIITLFYAFTPVWGAYAKHAFKDTFAAGLFALYFIMLELVIRRYTCENNNDKQVFAGYAVSGFVACLFRNNFIYVIAPITCVLAIYIIAKEKRIINGVIVLSCIILFLAQQFVAINVCGVKKASMMEALSIPLQQTARTVKYHKTELNQEEINQLNAMFDVDLLGDAYDPVISDPIKGGCIRDKECRPEDSTSQWINVYMKLMLKYPLDYVEAAVAQSYGYYCFTPKLPEQSGNWNSGMTIFDWIGCNGDFDEQFNFHYMQWSGILRQVLHQWARVYDKIPIVSITDVCAIYTWITIAIGYVLARKRKFICLLPVFSLILMIMTCIASPVNDCFRYFAPVAAATPFLALML